MHRTDGVFLMQLHLRLITVGLPGGLDHTHRPGKRAIGVEIEGKDRDQLLGIDTLRHAPMWLELTADG